jgi:hypothetical protein
MPAIYSVGPSIEAKMFAVVRDVELVNEEQNRSGTSFYVQFRKVRRCEFVALVWYQGAVRLLVDFEPHSEDVPRTRPPGEQFSGPWFVRGLKGLDQSRAYVYHRCHPLWMTITPFYKG